MPSSVSEAPVVTTRIPLPVEQPVFHLETSTARPATDASEGEEKQQRDGSQLGPRSVRPHNASDPVFVLGMPKSGTSSIAAYFECGGKKVSHFLCDEREHVNWKVQRRCGDCIYANVNEGVNPLQGCGNYDVWAQMDRDGDKGGLCYFPQIENLEELHQYYPDATFILNLRPVAKWVSSVQRWGTLHERLINCDVTGFPRGTGQSSKELITWYKGHVSNVRRFLSDHHSHGLVTVQVEDNDAGQVLEEAFGISHTCWGKHNVNKKKRM